MFKLKSFIVYTISLLLALLFSIIVITENTNLVSDLYKNKIIKTIELKSSLGFSMKNLEVKWDGLDTHLIFNDISFYKKDTKDIYIRGESIILNVNLFHSLFTLKLKPSELNLVNSDITLLYDKTGLFIKDYNLFDANNFNNTDYSDISSSDIKFRISNSDILIKNRVLKKSHKLKNINLVLFKNDNNLQLFTTFNNDTNNAIIHLASKFFISDGNKISGSFYSQGLNIDSSYESFFFKQLNINTNNMKYELWADISNNSIKNLNGALSINQAHLYNNLNKKEILLENISTNFKYNNNSDNLDISLTNMNAKSEKNVYESNNILLTFNRKNLKDLFIDKIYIDDLMKIAKTLPFKPKRIIKSMANSLHTGTIEKLSLLDINDKNKFRYSAIFNEISISNSEDLFIDGLSGQLLGNSVKGKLTLSSTNTEVVPDKFSKYELSEINGLVNYQFKNNELSISSNKLTIDESHSVKVSGTLATNKSKLKLNIKGDIDKLLNKFPKKDLASIISKNISIMSKYELDYRLYRYGSKTNSFGVINFRDLVIFNKDLNLTFNSKHVRINFFDKYLQSHKNQYYMNNNQFHFYLNTQMINKSMRYSIDSNGILTSNFLKNTIKNKLLKSFDGKSLSNFSIIYEPNTNKIFAQIASSMKGMSFNIVSPFKKGKKEQKYLKINYVFDKSKKNNLQLEYDIYKMNLNRIDSHTQFQITSPYLQGLVTLPEVISESDRLSAELKYFNLNKFEGEVDPSIYPYLNLDIKQVKINDYYFNNVFIRTSPTEKGMMIETFNFENNHLQMVGTGKWIDGSNGQLTFFDASFYSDNFGTSLNSLGYSDVIKKGSLESRLIGQWKGSPDLFSLNTFDGKIRLDLSNGEFLQVTKQTRAIGQLLGLFSISSLQKRLSLDFSDFFSTGLSFDTMEGEFIFSKAMADINSLDLKGSFGEMSINGQSNLENRTHNQKLVYIPDLSSMSLISGTLLGGPIGAVASIFYDRVMKEFGINTNQLAAVEYSIKGSWDNPEIKVIETFKPIEN